MTWTFWLVAASIFGIAAFWMSAAFAVLGVVLKFSCQEICDSRLFSFVRIVGARNTLHHFANIIRLNGVRALKQRFFESWRPLVAGLLFPLLTGITALGYPAIINALFYKYARPRLLYTFLERAQVICLVLGVCIGVYVLFGGLGYAAKPQNPRRSNLPALFLSRKFPRLVQNRLAVNTFLYQNIGLATRLAAAYPWIFFVLVLSADNSTSSSSSHGINAYQALAAVAFFCAALALSTFPPLLISRLMRRKLVFVRAAILLCTLVEQPQPSEAAEEADSSVSSIYVDEGRLGLAADSLGGKRSMLAEASSIISAAANELDSSQPAECVPHPISTILRALARSIQEFLVSDKSFAGSIPRDLSNYLAETLALLVCPSDSNEAQLLGQRMYAFDKHGDPAVELIQKSPGRLSIFVGQAADKTQKTSSFLKNLAWIAGMIVIIVILLATRGHNAFSQFLSYPK